MKRGNNLKKSKNNSTNNSINNTINNTHFELMVVGGGTAGLRTAFYAANHGYKTLMIEPSDLGGTCLNKGCIPTKAMLHASHLYQQTKNLNKFGINVSNVKINFSKLMQRVHDIINDGQTHIKQSLKNSDLKVVRSAAKFIDDKKVKAGNKIYSADKIIICTGAKTWVPPVTGLNDYMISDDIINLKKLPKSITVIGGGYISTEFATFFANLGTKVTIIERGPRLLGAVDPDVSEELTKRFLSKKVRIETNANIIKVDKNKVFINEVNNPKSKTKTITSEKILVATGRIPNTKTLELDKTKVKTDKRGNIIVNQKLQTSNKDIFAIGDCNGKAMFAHSAKRESHIALENSLNNKNSKMDWHLMPWAVFTDPVIAGIGVSEQQANDLKINYEIMRASFSRAGRSTIIDDTDGFVKVLYQEKTNKIIGVTIIGPNADDIIHEFVTLMNTSSPTITNLRKSIHIHPTLSEVVEALK